MRLAKERQRIAGDYILKQRLAWQADHPAEPLAQRLPSRVDRPRRARRPILRERPVFPGSAVKRVKSRSARIRPPDAGFPRFKQFWLHPHHHSLKKPSSAQLEIIHSIQSFLEYLLISYILHSSLSIGKIIQSFFILFIGFIHFPVQPYIFARSVRKELLFPGQKAILRS